MVGVWFNIAVAGLIIMLIPVAIGFLFCGDIIRGIYGAQVDPDGPGISDL